MGTSAAALVTLAVAVQIFSPGRSSAAVVEACGQEVAEAAVRKAEETVEYFKSYRRDAAFTARLAQAEGALIAPDAGTLAPAVFLVREGVAGEWKYPVFYQVLNPHLSMADAETDFAFLFLNRDGVEGVMAGGLELTPEGPVSFTAIGPGADGTSGIELIPDVAVFASDMRAKVAGSRITPMPACTEAFYGSPVSPTEVVRGDFPRHTAADQLREALLVLPPPRVVPR